MHTFSHKSLLVLIAGFAFAVAAAEEKPAKREPLRGNDCVFFRSVYDWKELDDQNMVLWTSGRRAAYHVYVAMPLYSKSSVELAFVDRDRDGQICGFSRDEVAATDRTYPQHSTITAMKRLDAAGIAELEQYYKVSLTQESKKKKPKEPNAESAQ